MPKKLTPPSNATDSRVIFNTVRQYAAPSFRDQIPQIPKGADYHQYLKIGERIVGNIGLANEFVSTLINQVALVIISKMDFTNNLARFRKGYLEFGETVEDIFVGIAKAYDYEPEDAPAVENAYWPAEVYANFYALNVRLQYRVTVSEEQLRTAFTAYDGLRNLMDYIIRSVYTAMEYDTWLLTQYLVIKAVANGRVRVETTDGYGNALEAKPTAALFGTIQGQAGLLAAPSRSYNEAGVLTSTPAERMTLLVSSRVNGALSAEVLAYMFGPDYAQTGFEKIVLPAFDAFDNDRFVKTTTSAGKKVYLKGYQPITDDELAVMRTIDAVLVDTDWFQVYDNLIRFESHRVTSAHAWNNFLSHWMTLANSPYANIVAFGHGAPAELPTSFTGKVVEKVTDNGGTVFAVKIQDAAPGTALHNPVFVTNGTLAAASIAVTPDGIITIPTGAAAPTLVLEQDGTLYTATTALALDAAVGTTLTFTRRLTGSGSITT